MSRSTTLAPEAAREYDRNYREGGLRAMASPRVHYDDAECPHEDCAHKMEWIDFKLELHGDPERIYKPLVKAWWEGNGIVGRCPSCQGLIQFTTLGMKAIEETAAQHSARLPGNWSEIAQFG